MTVVSPETKLLNALQSELITAGLARQPSNAGPQPPLWMEPADGVPAPGELTGAQNDNATVLGVFATGEVARQPFDARPRPTIQLRIRTRGNKPVQRAWDVYREIEDHIVSADAARYNFTLGTGGDALLVVSVDLWSPFTRLESSSQQGMTYIVTWMFELFPNP